MRIRVLTAFLWTTLVFLHAGVKAQDEDRGEPISLARGSSLDKALEGSASHRYAIRLRRGGDGYGVYEVLVRPFAEEARTLRLADGVEMAFVERGTGDPALVFVHCGNCRKEIWRETLDAFAGTHRVVAMDLPGHGSSGANRERFTIDSLGADVAALVEHLKLQRVILVGNSLGGPVALEAAKRLGSSRVLAVVAVDTLHNVELVWPEEDWRRQLDAYRKDFRPACDELMLRLLPKTAPASVRERIDRETCDNDPKAAIALLETFRTYDQAEAIRAAGVPVWAINSKVFPTSVEINRKHARSFEVILMDGVGHYPQVERPEEFQRHLRRVIETVTAPPAAASPRE